MSRSFKKMVERLRRLDGQIRHAREQSEARVLEFNGLIRQLGAAGCVGPVVLLGRLLHRYEYTPGAGPSDSEQVVQAALSATFGFGVIMWNSEEYARLAALPDGPEAEAQLYYRPFDECEGVLQALLLPEIEPLLERFMSRLP